MAEDTLYVDEQRDQYRTQRFANPVLFDLHRGRSNGGALKS